MSTAIHDFGERVEPLRNILETAYKEARSRKKKAIEKFRLASLGWSDEHVNAFLDQQQQIRESFNLPIEKRILSSASSLTHQALIRLG